MRGKLKVDLSDRKILVTGASGGLGKHFSVVLAEAGAYVFCASRNIEKLNIVKEQINDNGGKAKSVLMDVKNQDSVASAIETCGPIDILVNNAGVAITKKFLSLSRDDWDNVINTNLRGSWSVASAVVRQMVARECQGSIINIASIFSERVASGVLPYAISKSGVVQMTRAMAVELAEKGIRVNAIAPGYIKTDMNREFLESKSGERIMKRVPQKRFGEPQDLNGALLLLASDCSNFMTGAVITVDGGHLVSAL